MQTARWATSGHVTCTYLKIILTTANKNIFHFNSLGLIPVVLIAAVLAGSGCFVIKKDHAENFANIQTLTDQLRADNVNTIKTVAAMKKSIDQKDSIIKELQQKVTAGNEKNRLVSLAFRYDTVSASLWYLSYFDLINVLIIYHFAHLINQNCYTTNVMDWFIHNN